MKEKKQFNLTWTKLIIFAVIVGIYAALMAIIPVFKDTSFNTIVVTFEVWILFGILIIMNSKSNKDAALKCFVFFLISQPIIYLLQVPFSWQGWGLFKYYKYWFIWTILCLPMGYIGYYMKKNKWWGYLILFPMILLTGHSYMTYLSYIPFTFPKYILISLFCIVAIIGYPLYIFKDKKIRIFSSIVGSIFVIIISVISILKPYVYQTDVLLSSDENNFDNTYKVYLEDNKYGDVEIKYEEGIDTYLVHAQFKKEGSTVLILESQTGEKAEYKLTVSIDKYSIDKK